MLMTLLSIVFSTLGIWLLQESAGLTAKKLRLLLALLLIVISYLCIQSEFGALKGFFVLLGIISLLGPCITFFLVKHPLNQSNN